MQVSNHAEFRIRKRLGIKKKAVESMKAAALTRGMRHDQTTGRLNRYFDALYFKYLIATNVRIYANFVWIFSDTGLVTVFPIPKEFRKLVTIVSNKIQNV